MEIRFLWQILDSVTHIFFPDFSWFGKLEPWKMWTINSCTLAGKNTPIRLIAVREAGVSRQSWGPNWGHPSNITALYGIKGFKAGPQSGFLDAERHEPLEAIFSSSAVSVYTRRIFFEILLNQTEIRLYLPFSDLFETERTCAFVFRINRRMVNTILFRFDLIRFRKKFSVCALHR